MVTGTPRLEARSFAEGIDHHFLKPIDPDVWAELLSASAARVATTDA